MNIGVTGTDTEPEAIHREFYDQFAQSYDTHIRERTQHLVQLLPDIVELGGKRVLDVGVGTAEVWAELHRAGVVPAHVTGVDVSGGMLERAAARNLLFLKTVQGTVDMLPPILRFDVVTAMGLLRHVGDPGRLVAIASRSLVQGGIILIEDVSENDSNVRVGMAAGRVLADLLPPGPPSSFHLSDEALREAIEGTGLSLSRWEHFGFRATLGSFVEAWGYFLNETMLGWRINQLPKEEKHLARERMRKVVMETLKSPVLRREFFVATFEKR